MFVSGAITSAVDFSPVFLYNKAENGKSCEAEKGGGAMRIGAAEAYDEMKRDPERWLYTLSDLADPIRRGGL